jgi:HlyD family secretion protein
MELFRKSALETLSSPEQLDQLMQITKPRSWIALAALVLVLAAAVVWGVFGSLPTSITGQGVVIREGGTFKIVALGSGVVTELAILKTGDLIRKGQVLGRITQPALAQQIEAAKADLQRLQTEERAVKTAVGAESHLQTAAYRLQQEMQLKVIQAKEEQLRSLQAISQQQKELLQDGLITRQRYEETRQAIYGAQNDIAAARSTLQRLAVQQTEIGSQQGDRLRGEGSRIAQTVNRLNELQLQYRLTSTIVSDRDGSVVEMMATNGDVVTESTPILSAEISQRKYDVMVYLPANSNAEMIKPGMAAQVSLATSKKERYGYLVGRVLSVSKYPSTDLGMMAALNNAGLVREMSKTGPPIAVLVTLIPDAGTRSGYAWSSAAGAGVDFHSGTLCAGTFIIERRRPISLVIPLLKETVGL